MHKLQITQREANENRKEKTEERKKESVHQAKLQQLKQTGSIQISFLHDS